MLGAAALVFARPRVTQELTVERLLAALKGTGHLLGPTEGPLRFPDEKIVGGRYRAQDGQYFKIFSDGQWVALGPTRASAEELVKRFLPVVPGHSPARQAAV